MCERNGMIDWAIDNPPKNFPLLNKEKFSYPTPAMPDHCKVSGDAIQSYRNYYLMEKQRMADWSGKIAGRSVPSWFTEMSDSILESTS